MPKKYMKKLTEKQLEETHKILWDLNTRLIKREKVIFPNYSEDEILQLQEYRLKKYILKGSE